MEASPRPCILNTHPLPPEILARIFNYAKTWRGSVAPKMASFALVHTSFKPQAERLMYKRIRITVKRDVPEQDMRCLETLASVPAKAALVRRFELMTLDKYLRHALPQGGSEDHRDEWDVWPVGRLRDAIAGMEGLKHLTIGVDIGSCLRLGPEITSFISNSKAFDLVSLGINLAHANEDVRAWMRNLKHLQVLHLFRRADFTMEDLDFCQSLVNASLERAQTNGQPPLCVFLSPVQKTFSTRIYGFPCLYPRLTWSAQQIYASDRLRKKDLDTFGLYLRTLNDLELLEHALESIATYFPATNQLALVLEDPELRSNPQEFSRALKPTASRKGTDILSIKYIAGNRLGDGEGAAWMSETQKLELCISWRKGAKLLRAIHFPDRTKFFRSRYAEDDDAEDFLRYDSVYSSDES